MKTEAAVEWINIGITPRWVEMVLPRLTDWNNPKMYLQTPAGYLSVTVIGELAERWGIK